MFNIFKRNKMKTLKISDSKALELYKTASSELKEILEESFGKEFFKPKDITDIVYDIDTLAEWLNISVKDLFIFNQNTKDKNEKCINACNILLKVANVYNEEVILNWKNTSEYKYLPYINFSGGSGVVSLVTWFNDSGSPAGFYYKSDKLSRIAYNNFKIYFEDYWQQKI